MLKLINVLFMLTITALCFSNKAVAGQIFQSGTASYYGKAHHGKRTASGTRFNMYAMTAAHRTLPFGTKLRITSADTGKTVLVTVNDRGPYSGRRILDLSQEAARQLGMLKIGVGRITIEKLGKEEFPPTRNITKEDKTVIIDPIENLISDMNI